MKLRHLILTFALIVASAAGVASPARRTTAQPQKPHQQASAQQKAEGLSIAEFARLTRELSEGGGEFHSDNLISNETSYLHVVDKLRQLNATGGAYIGVGPEQNFSYIAHVRPRIAFIIDLRPLARVEHLMYKALFQLSPDRAQFLLRLLGKMPGKSPGKLKPPAADAPLNQVLEFVDKLPATDQAMTANLDEARKMIERDFQIKLSDAEKAGLEYIFESFRRGGLEIHYQLNGGAPIGRPAGTGGAFGGGVGGRGGMFPTLRNLITQTDLGGKQGNFLASAAGYDFVRGLQRRNLIIPVTGDFGGAKTLAGIGDYLRQRGYAVSAFYTSNVEQYLFEGGSFDAFARNVKRLPINDRSLIIRTANARFRHATQQPGHSFVTLLQQATVFLKDYDEGRYTDYRQLLNTHFIAAEK